MATITSNNEILPIFKFMIIALKHLFSSFSDPGIHAIVAQHTPALYGLVVCFLNLLLFNIAPAFLRRLITWHGPLFIWFIADKYFSPCPRTFKMWRVKRAHGTSQYDRFGYSQTQWKRLSALLALKGRSATCEASSWNNTTTAFLQGVLAATIVFLWYHIATFYQPLSLFKGKGLPAPTGSTAVVGLLITPDGMLLAKRGPLSKPPQIVGLLAGIGGKVDADESPEDALIREFSEETSLDISKFTAIPIGVIDYEGTQCAHYLVYSKDTVTPKVPASERSKVVDPQFFPLNRLPYQDMIPELSALLQSKHGLLGLAIRLTGSAAPPSSWVQRRLDTIPAEFALMMVNNKDDCCLLYALQPQITRRLDFETLEANIGQNGYAPDDIMTPMELRNLAVWECDIGKWTFGDPDSATIFLSYVRNGNYGHWDGMAKLTPGDHVRDYIIYPNGRGAYLKGTGADDAEPESFSAPHSNVTVTSEEDDTSEAGTGSTYTAHESHFDDANRFTLKGFKAIAKYMSNKLVKTETPAKPGKAAISPAVETTYWGAAYVAIQGVAQRLNDFIIFKDRKDLFIDVEYGTGLEPTKPTAKTGRLVAMLSNGVIGSAVRIQHNMAAMTARMEIVAKIGSGETTLTHWFDLTARPFAPVAHMVDNMVPTQAPEKFIDLTRNIAGLFHAAFTPAAAAQFRATDVSNDISRAIWSIDDRNGGDLTYIFERLIAGMMTAKFGAVPTPVTANLDFLRMFPTAAGWAYIWGTINPALPPNGVTRFKNNDGSSSITLLPLGSFQGIGNPAISATRDYRVALHMISEAYLGFRSNRSYGPNNADRLNYFASNACYADTIPYVTFLLPRIDTPVVRSVADYSVCARNPDSWKDAICILLKHFGRSADFAAAMDTNAANFVRHMSADQTMLPVPLSNRFQGGPKLNDCLMARLLTMRVLLPSFAATASPADKDFFGAMNALKHAGARLDGANDAAALARIRLIYTATTTRAQFAALTRAQLDNGVPDIDAEWHQFFSQVDLGADNATATANLDSITAGMTTDELNNLRVWLSDEEFVNVWLGDDAGARPDLRQEFLLEIPFCDRIVGDNDRNAFCPDDEIAAHLSGYNMLRSHSLCTFDVQRTKLVTVPCGVQALRQLCHGVDLYHGDTLALNINDALRSSSVDEILKRMLLVSTVWRTCSDSTVEELGITSSKLALALGVFETGNVQLDMALDNVDGRSKAGGMQVLLNDYITLLNNNLQSQGYDVSTLLVSRGTMVEWCNFQKFRYQNNVATDAVNMLFVATHHLISAVLTPNLKRTGGIISRRVEWMGNQVTGDQVPWDSWVCTSTEFKPTELLGALRIAVTTIGYCLTAPASVYYKSRSTQPLPTEYRVLRAFDTTPPRRSDTCPASQYFAIDPYSVHHPVLGYTASAITTDNVVTFLEPAWQFGYLSLVKASERAPTIAYNLINYSGVALANTIGKVIDGYGAQATFEARAEVYAGAAATMLTPLVDDTNTTTLDWIRYQPQSGALMSGNVNISKNLAPMATSLGLTATFDAVITNPGGGVIGGGYQKKVGNNITTGVWKPTKPLAATDYEIFASFAPGIVKRAEAWSYKITLFQLPANHSPLTDVIPVTAEQVLPFMNEVDAITHKQGQAAGIYDNLYAAPTEQRLPANHDGVTPNPALNSSPLVQSPDPYDGRHLLEGFKASARLDGKAADNDVAGLTKQLKELNLQSTKIQRDIKAAKAAAAKEERTAKKGKRAAVSIAPSDSISQIGSKKGKAASDTSTRITVTASEFAALQKHLEAEKQAGGSGKQGKGGNTFKSRFH
jgi:8-oxo-dGTP pyrophosphatase MutT (NUDIX family)